LSFVEFIHVSCSSDTWVHHDILLLQDINASTVRTM